jgi:hypothetical protein
MARSSSPADPPPPFAAAWIQQWREAAVALVEQKAHELRTMNDEEARAATDALVELGAMLPLSPERERDSGLVIQQALFHRKAPPE